MGKRYVLMFFLVGVIPSAAMQIDDYYNYMLSSKKLCDAMECPKKLKTALYACHLRMSDKIRDIDFLATRYAQFGLSREEF